MMVATLSTFRIVSHYAVVFHTWLRDVPARVTAMDQGVLLLTRLISIALFASALAQVGLANWRARRTGTCLSNDSVEAMNLEAGDLADFDKKLSSENHSAF